MSEVTASIPVTSDVNLLVSGLIKNPAYCRKVRADCTIKIRYNMIMLSAQVTKYFWGDDLSVLSWEKHREYIAQTILEKGDLKAIKWLLKKTNKAWLKKIVAAKKLSPKSKNFWKIYLD